ncbi:hypothetical protein niasHS_014348 [Heterodera schachtii]|uniref:Uncharacterized protein n=1 Tax=Heterodera schachtii TaxID=97005 RepID=A0ABD2IFF7_HETSC
MANRKQGMRAAAGRVGTSAFVYAAGQQINQHDGSLRSKMAKHRFDSALITLCQRFNSLVNEVDYRQLAI